MPASTVDTLGSVEFLERMVVYLRVSANFFFASKEIHEKKKKSADWIFNKHALTDYYELSNKRIH